MRDRTRWASVLSKTCIVISMLLSLTAIPGLLTRAYPTPGVAHQVAAARRSGSPLAAVREVTGGGIASLLGTTDTTYLWFHPRLRDAITTINGRFGQRFVATRSQPGEVWRVVVSEAGRDRTVGVVGTSDQTGDYTVVPLPGVRGDDQPWSLRAGAFHWAGSGSASAERANADAIGLGRSPVAIAVLLALLSAGGAVLASPQAVRLLTRAILLLIGPLLVVAALKNTSRASLATAATQLANSSSGTGAVLVAIAGVATGLMLGVVGYRGIGRLYARGPLIAPGLTKLLGPVLLAGLGLLMLETVGVLVATIEPGASV